MPFVLRTTETPPLNQILALEQIIIVDQTGPVIPLGVSSGIACMVAEFLKGPFLPKEVTSTGQILSTYGGLSEILSQDATGLQNGGGVRFEGNGMAGLLGKQFLRLGLVRVDTDVTTTDAGFTGGVPAGTKAAVKFTVTVSPADLDPLVLVAPFKLGKTILIPAGTRFADLPLPTATNVIALSQDVVIPKGTVVDGLVTPFTITVSSVGSVATTPNEFAVSQDSATGALTLLVDVAGLPALGVAGQQGPTAFFVKGTTAPAGPGLLAIDTVIDPTIQNTTSTITSVSTIDTGAAPSAIFAPGTIGAVLQTKIESMYASAIGKTAPSDVPASEITVLWSARRGATSSIIRGPLEQNAIDSSEAGRGRIAIVAGPRVGSATGDASSAAAAITEVETVTPVESPGRKDRKIVTFPYVQVFAADLGRSIEVAPDGFMASTLSEFPEEKSPGASNRFIQTIQSFQTAFANTPMGRQDYVNFKASGVAALLRDRAAGWWFQSGVTSVNPALEQTRAPIKRRRMADFIQDTISGLAANYNKQPATTERIDQLTGEMDAFLLSLKSPQNPSQQRIEDYFIDAKSANTKQLEGLGIFTFLIKVRLLASLDDILISTSIGESVEIPQTA